jgi:hypothetical protein
VEPWFLLEMLCSLTLTPTTTPTPPTNFNSTSLTPTLFPSTTTTTPITTPTPTTTHHHQVAMLQQISRAIGHEIHDVFDVVAGTSTGAIVASLIG